MNLPLTSNSENFDYNWQWAYNASEKTLKKALSKDKEKVISQLGNQLLKKDSVIHLELACKVIRCLTDQPLESETLKQFFTILNSTQALERDLRDSRDTESFFLKLFRSKIESSADALPSSKNQAMAKLCHEAIQHGNENLAIELMKQIGPYSGTFKGFYRGINLFSAAKEKGYDQLVTEIAKATVNACGEITGLISEHIHTYPIQDEAVRALILKLAIEQNPRAAIEFISNYQISDSHDIYEIAINLAREYGRLDTAKVLIESLDITDEASRLLILQAATLTPFPKDLETPVAQLIGDPQKRLDLFLAIFNVDKDSNLDIKDYSLEGVLHPDLFKAFVLLSLGTPNSQNIIFHLNSYLKEEQNFSFDLIMDQINQETNTKTKIALLKSLTHDLAVISNPPFTNSEKNPLVNAILQNKDSEIRLFLLNALKQFEDSHFYHENVSQNDSDLIKFTHIFINNFQIKSGEQKEWNHLSEKIKNAQELFNDPESYKTLINVFSLLSNEINLNSEDKLYLLNLIFDNQNSENIISSLNTIELILQFGNSFDFDVMKLKKSVPPINLLEEDLINNKNEALTKICYEAVIYNREDLAIKMIKQIDTRQGIFNPFANNRDLFSLAKEKGYHRLVSEMVKPFVLTHPSIITDLPKMVGDTTVRGEIATYLAEQDPDLVIKNIKSYNIDEASRIEVAKILAKKNPIKLLKNIHDFKIDKANALYEIAIIAIKQDPESCEYMEKIHTSNQSLQIDLFLLAYKEYPAIIEPHFSFFYLEKFHISLTLDKTLISSILEKDLQGESARIEIAKNEARVNPQSLIENFHKYGITQKSARLEIFQIAAETNPLDVLKKVDTFEIENCNIIEVELLALDQALKQMTATDFSHDVFKIDSFLFLLAQKKGHNQLVNEMVKAFVQTHPSIANSLNRFVIFEPAIRTEIVKFLAEKDAALVVKNFANYSIDGQASRIAIARITAKNNPVETLRNINKFDIRDEKALYEIALIALKEDPKSCIHMFDTGSQSYQIDLFLAAYPGNSKAFDNSLSSFLEVFHISTPIDQTFLSSILKKGLQGEAARIEIAKNEARFNPQSLIENFHKYGISEKAARLEIFQIVAENDPFLALRNLPNFSINAHPILDEINRRAADLALKQMTKADYSDVPNINNTSFQIDLFLAAYRKNPKVFNSMFRSMLKKFHLPDDIGDPLLASLTAIDKKGLTGESARIEIAKTAARNNQLKFTHIRKYYNITDEDAFLSIGKTWLKNGEDLIWIHHLEITNPEIKLKLFLFAFNLDSDAEVVFYNLSEYLPPELHECFLEFNKISPPTNLSNVLINLEKYYSGQKKNKLMDTLFNEISAESNSAIQASLLKWLTYAFATNLHSPSDIFNGDLVKVIYQFREPSVRFVLIDELKTMHEHPQFYQSLVSDKDDDFIKLSHLFLNNLQLEGGNEEEWKIISEKIKKSKLIFKEASSNKILIQTLSRLSHSETLTPDDKLNLLKLVFENENKKDILDKLSCIECIFQWNGSNQLKQASTPLDLPGLRQKLFLENIPIANLENLRNNYANTLGKFRKPTALFTYASALNQDEHAAYLLSLLGEFCDDIMSEKDAFPSTRYETKKNPHLQTIFKSNPKLKDKWQQGSSIPLTSLLLKKEEFSSDNFSDFFEKVFKAGHLKEKEYPYLKKYLNNLGPHPDKVDVLNQELKTIYVELKEKAKQKDLSQHELYRLNVQLALIPLLNPKLNSKRKERILINLSNDFFKGKKELGKDAQPKISNKDFLNDIEKMLESFKNASYRGWTVKNSDNPDDLLLLGTEVDGSCQSVEKDSYYNKCLLSYLLDGKNRAIIVADETGSIKARCILRLLWDPQKKVPVLFQEKSYFKGPEQATLQNALDLMCQKTAKDTGLILLSKNNRGSRYPSTIRGLEGRTQFEYVDALGGVQDGGYEISGTYQKIY